MRVSANTMPAKSISAAPASNMRFRPMRSACVVIHSEISVSPISVSVSSTPISVVLKPAWLRYNTRMTERKP